MVVRKPMGKHTQVSQPGDPAALVELCKRGLLTCTSGEPGDVGSTYALAWLPLDNAENYSPAVRKLHAENMRRLTQGGVIAESDIDPWLLLAANPKGGVH